MRKLNINNNKIVVVGDVMLDRYWFGNSTRISPEAPVPIVKVDRLEDRIGGAGNVALNIASLGCEAFLVSVIGNDEAGKAIQNILKKRNVKSILEFDQSIETTVKLRILSRNQQVLRCDFEKHPSDDALLKHLNSYENALLDAKAIVFSDYAKGGLEHIEKMIQIAKSRQKKILIDPKGSDYSKYKGATLITPNKDELRQVVGNWSTEDELTHLAQNLRKELDLQYLLLTRSEEGMTWFSGKGSITIPTIAKEVYDVSGAGDTVIAALAVALTSGLNEEEAVNFANKAAGIVVGKIGTATTSIEEINKFYR